MELGVELALVVGIGLAPIGIVLFQALVQFRVLRVALARRHAHQVVAHALLGVQTVRAQGLALQLTIHRLAGDRGIGGGFQACAQRFSRNVVRWLLLPLLFLLPLVILFLLVF